MSKYSVEVSHYIINIYKNNLNPNFDEELNQINNLTNQKVKQKLLKTFIESNGSKNEVIRLNSFNYNIDVNSFLSGNNVINDEILEVMTYIWKALPGKQISVQKFIGSAKLDIKLNNNGDPIIYRIIWKTKHEENTD